MHVGPALAANTPAMVTTPYKSSTNWEQGRKIWWREEGGVVK